MPESFTDTLRRECAADWRAGTEHRFVRELLAGCIEDAVMAVYKEIAATGKLLPSAETLKVA